MSLTQRIRTGFTAEPEGAERDPQYPYYRRWEAERMDAREEDEPDRTAAYNARMEREDTFNPDVNVRFYVSLEKTAPIGSGEGAIYSLEYLRRKGA